MLLPARRLNAAVAKFGDGNAVGWRDTIAMVNEEKEIKKVRVVIGVGLSPSKGTKR